MWWARRPQIVLDDVKVIPRDIAATDSRIDQLVYDLYDLTEKEIRIVEKAT